MKRFNDRLFVIAIMFFPAAISAGAEVSGTISQLFYADEQQVYYSISDIPTDGEFFEAQNPAYITYNNGELVITETIPLQKGADIREGLLSITVTVDLGSIQISGTTVIPNQFVRAEYHETQAGMVIFRGSAVAIDFSLIDFCNNNYQFGVAGEFSMIFVDETGSFAGCWSLSYWQWYRTIDQK